MNKIYTFLGNIQGLSVKKESDNPFFKSKYMNLDSIMDTVNPLLKDAGLILSHYGDGDNLVTAIIDPETGDKLESKLRIALDDPQKIGGCVTYFRRYNTCALLNILSDEDDDGNKASGKAEPRRVAPKPVAKPTVHTTPTWDKPMVEKDKEMDKKIEEMEGDNKCKDCGSELSKSKFGGDPYCHECWKNNKK